MNERSNLLIAIEAAMQNCWDCGSGYIETENLEICAEWVDSKNPGYSVIQVTILQDSVVKFSYDDYGTETEQ
ncbi:MAG: hypothetical protein IJZ63_05635 [Clostridia bacterium]|nr:hypothetical protein [Clostridia bacterium]